MSEEFGREYMESVLDKAVDRIESALAEFKTTLGSIPLNAKRGTKRDAVEMVNGMVKAYPPERMTLPDGTPMVESPILLALQFSDISGGKELMKEYRNAMKTLPLEELMRNGRN